MPSRWVMLTTICACLALGACASSGGHGHRRPQQRLVSVPWWLAKAHNDLVTVRYEVPTCTYAFVRTTARQTPTTVTVGVYYRYTGPLPRGYACSAVASLATATVRLRSLLGRRRLLHAPVTAGVSP